MENINKLTGYPEDEYGHLLVPETLEPVTDPYGSLEFVHGSSDDFFCFDYEIIGGMEGGKFVVLHSVYNTETGSAIGDLDYQIIPLSEYRDQALGDAYGGYEDVRHAKRGWNQDWWYFYRCVELAVREARGEVVPRFSDRQKRFGGKRIDTYLGR